MVAVNGVNGVNVEKSAFISVRALPNTSHEKSELTLPSTSSPTQ